MTGENTSPAEFAAQLGRELSATAVDGNGWTDLHYAVALDWSAMARALPAVGVPLDARLRTHGELFGPGLLGTPSCCGPDRFGQFRRTGATPLPIAAAANACEAVAVLLERGADPDVADATSATPLHYAAAWRPVAAGAPTGQQSRDQADGRDSLERRA